ncbi:uncharacterized protein LOC128735604 [Sabethes cyaneus]|uniref:uncharacterized protein LOC128735604 n=1 Tax=Sabethes cyaneus TaxID=53552 RepID=UPI00237D7D91|nr:uncharacterized protein LOC128735604 [Sabethes cyaneus]
MMLLLRILLICLVSAAYCSQALLRQSDLVSTPECVGDISWTLCTDCRTLLICIGYGVTFEVTCEGSSGQYCGNDSDNNGICVTHLPECEPTTEITTTSTSTISSTTSTTSASTTTSTVVTTTEAPPAAAASLQCTGVGFYPDPYDCNAYHYCTAYRENSEPRRCPTGYGFHYTSAASNEFPCKGLTLDTDCLSVVCSGRTVFDVYDAARLFYAHCHTDMSTGLLAIAMYRCTDGATFNGNGCVFKCTEEGLFANTVQPTTYYRCSYMYGDSLSLLLLYCPRNLQFDNTLKKCV